MRGRVSQVAKRSRVLDNHFLYAFLQQEHKQKAVV